MIDSVWRNLGVVDDVYFSGTEERGADAYDQGEACEDGSWRDGAFHLQHYLLVPCSRVGWQ